MRDKAWSNEKVTINKEKEKTVLCFAHCSLIIVHYSAQQASFGGGCVHYYVHWFGNTTMAAICFFV